MKKIIIEWKHYDKEGNTCVRCSNTGTSLSEAIGQLKKEFKHKVDIVFKETKLSEDKLSESNSILINDVLVEELLDNTKSIETPCDSCCELVGSSVNCRALDCHGQTTEDIPVELIKTAVRNLLRKDNK